MKTLFVRGSSFDVLTPKGANSPDEMPGGDVESEPAEQEVDKVAVVFGGKVVKAGKS